MLQDYVSEKIKLLNTSGQRTKTQERQVFDVNILRNDIKNIFKNKIIKREHGTVDPFAKFSVTELSDCLFKSFLRRVGHILHRLNMFSVSISSLDPFGDLHMVKGVSIHKTVQQEVERYCKEKNINVVMEKYYFVNKHGGIGGKPDLFFPDIPLLVDIKTASPKNNGYFSSAKLSHNIQLYLLMWILRENGYENLNESYIWYLPTDSIDRVVFNQEHVQNFLERVNLLRNLVSRIDPNIDVDDFLLFIKTNRSAIDMLVETTFCKYCSLGYMCSRLLDTNIVGGV